MQEQIIRKLFLGFIHIHILHHAKKRAFLWVMDDRRT